MKPYLPLIAAAFALSACGGSEPAPATQPAVSASPVVAPEAVAQPQVPAECQIVINSDDAMRFDKPEIAIQSSCEIAQLTLNHTGKIPKAAMGHNIVIAAAADKAAIITDGAAAKLENDYLKPKDPRVIAATKMLGGGESDTITFKTDKLKNGDFEFFCTFPSHAVLMSGKVKMVD